MATLSVALLLTGGSHSVQATDRTWTGAISFSWNNATNWSPQGIPNTGDTLHLSGGSIDCSPVVNFSGRIEWTGGQLYAGRLTVAPETVLTISGAGQKEIFYGSLENFGRIVWTNAGNLVWTSPNGMILNQAGGVWEIQGDGSLLNYLGNSGTVTNVGTVLKTAGTTTNVLEGAFNNLGRVETRVGTLQFQAHGLSSTGSGEFVAAVGAKNQFHSGNYRWNGARFTGGGANRILGYVVFNGTLASENLELAAGGQWAGNATVTGQALWTGGQLYTDRLTMAANALLTISGAGQKEIFYGSLENFGRVVWTNAGNLVWTSPNGMILNQAGGVWEIQGDGSLLNYLGNSGTVTNVGTVLKTAGTTTNVLEGAFNNLGRVEIATGAVRFPNAVVLSPSSVLSFGIGGTIPGTQHGLLLVDSSLVLNGTVQANLKNGFVPTTNQTFNVLSASTLSGTFSNLTVPVVGGFLFSPEYQANRVILRVTLRTPSPASLTVVGWRPGGFRIQFAGDVGGNYRLDTSTNLIDWVSRFTTNLPTSLLEYTDSAATNYPRLFYRAVALP